MYFKGSFVVVFTSKHNVQLMTLGDSLLDDLQRVVVLPKCKSSNDQAYNCSRDASLGLIGTPETPVHDSTVP